VLDEWHVPQELGRRGVSSHSRLPVASISSIDWDRGSVAQGLAACRNWTASL
jgi:hypothetical protein